VDDHQAHERRHTMKFLIAGAALAVLVVAVVLATTLGGSGGGSVGY
jgi:hypothetical protein